MSSGPFTLSIIGVNGLCTYFLKVRSTETDSSTRAVIVAELSRYIVSLRQLRDSVEDVNDI